MVGHDILIRMLVRRVNSIRLKKVVGKVDLARQSLSRKRLQIIDYLQQR